MSKVLVTTDKIMLNEPHNVLLTSGSVYNKYGTENCKRNTTLILIIEGFIAIILPNPT